jgi:hypothetical protein
MKFEITFAIYPEGVFGVPEERGTVLPARAGTYTGAPIRTATLTIVGYGSLSEYRQEYEAIALPLHLGNIEGRIQDNFMFFQTEAITYREAYDTVVHVLERFLQHLSVNQRRPFTYKPLIIEAEDGKLYPVPKILSLGRVTHYNLGQLCKDIQEAETACFVQDAILDRALQYFEHALLLYEKRSQIADALSRHYRYLIAAVFLNLWKAVSVIVGDPSHDCDYQRHYRQFGFDYQFFTSKIQHLNTLRNSYDVAHYSLDENLLKEVDANVGEAENIAAEVLRRYREYIGNRSASKEN